jgi:hypothetical protein
MIKQILLFLLLAFCLSGCGGGGGGYFPPSIVLNSKGITKISFNEHEIGNVDINRIDSFRRIDHTNYFSVEGDKYYISKEIVFNKERLRIAIPMGYWVSVINSEDQKVTKLETPRYANDAVAVELTHSGFEPYLAILIQQQATSHSSTLYILDSFFHPIYKEHLLGGIWISKIKSSDGDKLLISTEDKWRPKGRWLTIGGNWQYDIFSPGFK